MHTEPVIQTKEDYHRYTGKLASLAMEEEAQRGEITCAAPVGYKNALIKGKRTVIIDEEMAPLIREAFQLKANGMSLRKILAELTPKGLRSRNGKVMGPSALKLVLENPFYKGYVEYKGTCVPAKHAPLVESSSVHLPNDG